MKAKQTLIVDNQASRSGRHWFLLPACSVFVFVVLTLQSLAAFAAERPKAKKSPNILLILTDDQGWSQTSQPMDPRVAGSSSSYLETPHIARLARGGMVFTSGYSPAPNCTPSRRSILNGITTARGGTEFRSPWRPAEHLTIPKALKKVNAAYRAAHLGKWGEHMVSTPEECGYDASDGMTGNDTGGMPGTLGVVKAKGQDRHAAGPDYFVDDKDPKRTETVTSRAIEFMRAQHREGHPFYVQVSYYATHLSIVTRRKTLEKYQRKGEPDRGYTEAWAAMMDDLDQGVGRLLDALDELDIDDETYVFFMADNGGRGSLPGGKIDDNRLPPNHPLTGAKASLWEGGIRVPFLASGPGIKAGSVTHSPVAGYDFLPTFHALAGGKPGTLGKTVDGVSLVPLFSDPKRELQRPRKALFFHRPARLQSAVRQGDHKLLVTWTQEGRIASRDLHSVNSDPREVPERNLAASQRKKADALQALLLDYLKSVDAEKPTSKSVPISSDDDD